MIDTTAVTLANGESAVNKATVSTPYDLNAGNDKASVESQVGPGFAAVPVTDNPDVTEVLPGDPVVFTGTYYNTGPSVSTSPQYKLETDGITTDDVDVIGFTVRASDGTSLTAADCTMTAAAGDPVVVTCNRASLPVGVKVEIDLTLSPKATTKRTEIKTRATSSATNDPGGPRSITATATIPATADLELTKTATSDLIDTDGSVLVDTNKTVTYKVRVVNKGPRESGTVRITDQVPAGLTPESAKWSLDGGPSDQACNISGQSIDCPGIGSIAPTGDSGPQFAELTIVARADQGGSGLRTNTASVAGTAVDPAEDNNSASAEVELLPTADLQIKKSGPSEITSGSKGSFTLVALNNGPSDMTGVVVADTLPSGIEFTPRGGAAIRLQGLRLEADLHPQEQQEPGQHRRGPQGRRELEADLRRSGQGQGSAVGRQPRIGDGIEHLDRPVPRQQQRLDRPQDRRQAGPRRLDQVIASIGAGRQSDQAEGEGQGPEGTHRQGRNALREAAFEHEVPQLDRQALRQPCLLEGRHSQGRPRALVLDQRRCHQSRSS